MSSKNEVRRDEVWTTELCSAGWNGKRAGVPLAFIRPPYTWDDVEKEEKRTRAQKQAHYTPPLLAGVLRGNKVVSYNARFVTA